MPSVCTVPSSPLSAVVSSDFSSSFSSGITTSCESPGNFSSSHGLSAEKLMQAHTPNATPSPAIRSRSLRYFFPRLFSSLIVSCINKYSDFSVLFPGSPCSFFRCFCSSISSFVSFTILFIVYRMEWECSILSFSL